MCHEGKVPSKGHKVRQLPVTLLWVEGEGMVFLEERVELIGISGGENPRRGNSEWRHSTAGRPLQGSQATTRSVGFVLPKAREL